MNCPEHTEEQERERREAEDRAGESRMEQRREMKMNEWELTPDELREHVRAAKAAWNKLLDSHDLLRDVPQWDEFLADYTWVAAQRKMAGWAIDNMEQWQRGLCPDSRTEGVGCIHFVSCRACWLDHMTQSLATALSPQQEPSE